MNKKLFLIIFLLLLSIFNVYCWVDPDNTNIFSNETYLSYGFSSGNDFFKSFIFNHYDGSSFQLNFTCIHSINTTCSSQINESEKKQMYGDQISYYTTDKTYRLDPGMYPTPIVSTPFKPSTKGEKSIIKGSYLVFSEKITVFDIIYPTRREIKILDIKSSSSFDATNVNVEFPSGCGYQVIKWVNGINYNFSYASPTISKIKITSTNIIVNGSDFCDSTYQPNITIDGIAVQSSIIKKDHDSIVFNYSQLYTSKSLMRIVTSNITSVEAELQFKPEPLIINSVPINKGGLIILDGLRLSSSQTNIVVVKIGNLTCLNAISTSYDSISCNLNPSIINNTSPSTSSQNNFLVSVTINNITNENTLLFNYGVVRLNPNKYSLPDRYLQLNGDCLGNINNTVVYLNGNETKLNDLQINHYETTLSFKIPAEYKSKLNVSVKSNNIMSNEIQIDISFYASVPSQTPNTNGNSTIIFTLNNILPENYNKQPNIRINQEQIQIDGISLKNSTNQEVQSFSFLIPPGCGKKEIEISIGNQSCSSSYSYTEPTISNCFVSGFDGKSGEIICNGNLGNRNYLNKSSVLFSNNEIIPTIINTTTLSFPLLSAYYTDGLIFEICGIESKPFKLDISPSLKRTDKSEFSTVGGKFYILGEFIGPSLNSTVFCNDLEYQSNFENSTALSFDINIQGPNDLLCNYTFDNGKNSSNFKIEYPLPIVSNTSKIYTSGGNLTIYGKNFYNISNIQVEIDNYLKCTDVEFFNVSIITCSLPPIEESEQFSIFNRKLLVNNTTIFSNKLLLNITFDSKSWNGYIFQYSKDEVINSGNSENSNNQTINSGKSINKNKSGSGIKLSLRDKILIGVIIPGVILSIIIFSLKIYDNSNIRKARKEEFIRITDMRKVVNLEVDVSRGFTEDVLDVMGNKHLNDKCSMVSHITRTANQKTELVWAHMQEQERLKQEQQSDQVGSSNQFQQQEQQIINDEVGSSNQFQQQEQHNDEVDSSNQFKQQNLIDNSNNNNNNNDNQEKDLDNNCDNEN
ncbi:hypothetical protein RB653_010078 [Dictyostelium firmibasis]|uniref:TgrO1-like immunoglobulin-like domain-containing protein n=1 Tax=Dictyostelium firmibasis TaxID=79012 RepID=A0AAN7TKB6_9MYCE